MPKQVVAGIVAEIAWFGTGQERGSVGQAENIQNKQLRHKNTEQQK